MVSQALNKTRRVSQHVYLQSSLTSYVFLPTQAVHDIVVSTAVGNICFMRPHHSLMVLDALLVVVVLVCLFVCFVIACYCKITACVGDNKLILIFTTTCSNGSR